MLNHEQTRMHTSHNEGGSQLEMQARRRMLFSATVGSTFSLPYSACHSVSRLFFSSPAHLITPPTPSFLVVLRVAFRFKLQVAICPKLFPSPFYTQESPEPAPVFTFPHPYLAGITCFLFSKVHYVAADSSTCVREPVCAVLVNDPLLSFLPTAFFFRPRNAWACTLSPDLPACVSLGQDAGGGGWGSFRCDGEGGDSEQRRKEGRSDIRERGEGELDGGGEAAGGC